jgi:putative spermidine/putrescine transport system substrate-binding protein
MISRRSLISSAVAAPLVFGVRARAADTLYVLGWPGFADQPMLDRFAAITGIGLVVDLVSSYDEIFARLRDGFGNPYSVIVPHHGLTLALKQQGLIQAIDTAQVPTLSQVDPHFALDNDTVISGEKCAIPVLFGTTPCIYNVGALAELPTSWADLDSDDFTGKVGMLDDGLSHFYVAGRAIGSDTTPALMGLEFNQAENVLTELKAERVSHFTAYPNDLADQLRRGKAVISTTGAEGMTLMPEAGGKLGVARLAPGDFGFVQTLAITTNAPLVPAAYQFIDFMLGASEQAALAIRTARGIVNPGAVSLLPQSLLNLTNYHDLDAVFAQSPLLGFPPLSETARGPKSYLDWVLAWDAIRQTKSRAAR